MKLFLNAFLFATALFGNAAALDVVFQIDESGSMSNDQAAVKRNAKQMFQDMQSLASGYFRAGLVGYGRRTNYGRPRVLTGLTGDYSTFETALNRLEVSGSKEPGFLAIYETATDSLQGSAGALGISGPFCGIIITDERSNPGPIDKTEGEATGAMNAVNSVQFAIDMSPTHFDGVTLNTGGSRFSISSFRSNPTTATNILNSVLTACSQKVPIIPPNVNPPSGGSGGDPHFKLWSGQKYDFHGVCDLVLLENVHFDNGLGLHIHIRTKKTRMWSYIHTAAVRIGNDILEVMGGKSENDFWVNMERSVSTQDIALSGYKVSFEQTSKKARRFVIDLGDGDKIELKTWNDFVSLNVEGKTADRFTGSGGLMGTYPMGLKMGRDFSTVFDDVNAFGQEWQVDSTSPMLFHNADGPQYPDACTIPSATQMRRQLSDSVISKPDAELACSRVDPADFELCVFDVLATNDKDSAGAY